MTTKLSLDDSAKWLCEQIITTEGGLAIGKIGTNELNGIIFFSNV